jgi:hypothetical protein
MLPAAADAIIRHISTRLPFIFDAISIFSMLAATPCRLTPLPSSSHAAALPSSPPFSSSFHADAVAICFVSPPAAFRLRRCAS